MTKSFDEWFGKASQNRLFWESPSKASKMGFEAGAQSKQAEIDELKREMLNKTNEAYADGQKSMRKMIKSNEDELQKRIDEALRALYERGKTKDHRIDKVYEILKGNTNEH